MDLNWIHFIILITSGLLVGFINTLAGGGTIISLSVFMLFGLPPNVANGTNRIAVLLQNTTAVINFSKKKLIEWPKAIRLAIPVIGGSVAGAILANLISNSYFHYFFGAVILFSGVMLLIQPGRWLEEKKDLIGKPLRAWHYILFFLIGIYGGFIHIAVGYMILTALVLGTGNELVKANAMKNFLVLSYIPFTILIFGLQGNIDWELGLIHSIGNIIGAQIASSFAIRKGGRLIRYMMLLLIIVVLFQLFGIIDAGVVSQWLQTAK